MLEKDISFCNFLRRDGKNIAPFLYMLKNSGEYVRYYESIVNCVRGVFFDFDDFVFETLGAHGLHVAFQWKKQGSDMVLGADQASSGMLRFIMLATALLQPPDLMPEIVVIDEPELSLGIAELSVLAKMIEDTSMEYQVVVATNSNFLINYFDVDSLIVAEKRRGGHILYRKNIKK